MAEFAAQYPVIFSLVIVLIPAVGMKLLYAGMARFELSELTKRLLLELAFCGYVAALLTGLGWWQAAGFVSPGAGKTLWAYAPWLLLPTLGLLSGGVRKASPRQMLGYTAFVLMVGFAEEGLLRGLTLYAMLSDGVILAAVLSSFFFGIAHLLNVLQGHEFRTVLVQVLYATFIGIGFAGPRLYTGTIWPAIVLHTLINWVDFAGRGFAMPNPKPFVFKQAIIPLALTGGYALYGWWLLLQL